MDIRSKIVVTLWIVKGCPKQPKGAALLPASIKPDLFYLRIDLISKVNKSDDSCCVYREIVAISATAMHDTMQKHFHHVESERINNLAQVCLWSEQPSLRQGSRCNALVDDITKQKAAPQSVLVAYIIL